jgi:DNA adenine methylase
MDSCLRWAGSKRQLLPRLLSYHNSRFTRYVEPFCGSACLFFALEPKDAVLGDLNEELIHAFRELRLDSKAVARCLAKFPLGEDAYYEIRRQDPATLEGVARAARFLYLNRFCFNGIYRTNMKGQFNVPFGPQKKVTPFPVKDLEAIGLALRRTILVQGDFEATLGLVRAGDFVFIDPPYSHETRRVFQEYGPIPFTTADLDRLSKHLDRIDQLGAGFVLSYTGSQKAKDLFSKWPRKRVRVRRNVAGFASHRKGAYEIVVTNITAS